MKKQDYYYVMLMEECAEIQQAVAKILRFGLDDTHPDFPELTNEKDFLTEYYQLMTVVEELQKQQKLVSWSEEQIQAVKNEKKQKIAKYLEYSKARGFVEEENRHELSNSN